MAIEWVAISAAVIPHVKKYAADRAGKLAAKYADGAFAKIYRRVVPDEKLVKVNEAFVTRFSKELESWMDLPTVFAESYQDALRALLSNPSVQETLQAPLDGQSELDWELLRGIWAELHLIELPDGFEWVKVARTYRQAIQRLMLADPELLPVIVALATIRIEEATLHIEEAGERTAAAVERLVGPARSFDLARYAEAVKAAHATSRAIAGREPAASDHDGHPQPESGPSARPGQALRTLRGAAAQELGSWRSFPSLRKRRMRGTSRTS